MSERPSDRAPVVVDARGLRCPAPVLLAARTARTLAPGTVLQVLASDPAAALDLPAWAGMRGHAVSAVRRGPGVAGPTGDGIEVDLVIGGA